MLPDARPRCLRYRRLWVPPAMFVVSVVLMSVSVAWPAATPYVLLFIMAALAIGGLVAGVLMLTSAAMIVRECWLEWRARRAGYLYVVNCEM